MSWEYETSKEYKEGDRCICYGTVYKANHDNGPMNRIVFPGSSLKHPKSKKRYWEEER